jgi:hypothetical protein
MSNDEDVLAYVNKLHRPVNVKDVEKHFKKMSDGKFAQAMAKVKRICPHQLVGSPSTSLRTALYLLPPAWLKKNEERCIPRSTAKGICILKTMDQDIYTDVCYEFCPSFCSCVPDIREYFKHNGLKWNYDESKIANGRLKRILNNMGSYNII